MISNSFAFVQLLLIPLGILVVLGVLAYFFLGGRRESGKRARAQADKDLQAGADDSDTRFSEAFSSSLDADHGVASAFFGEPTLPGTAGPSGHGSSAGLLKADADTARAEVAQVAVAVAKAAEKISLLVVDDSAVPRAKLRKLFEANGYQVVCANDGVQALDAMTKTKFAVVITDLEMPNMNGFELIAAIQGKLETEDIPVIAITGHEEMSAQVQNLQGLFGIFRKPWVDLDLMKRVDMLAALKK